MKKIYGVLLLSIFSLALNAQIKKNAVLLGGQLSFINTKNNYNNSNVQKYQGASFGISFGKAIKENKVVGLILSYSTSSQSNIISNSDSVSSRHVGFDPGLFFRDYKKIATNFYFYGQLDAVAGFGKGRDFYQVAQCTARSTTTSAQLGFTPGLSYKILKKAMIELSLPNIVSARYFITKVKSNNSFVQNTQNREFAFTSNLSNNSGLGNLGIGFRLLL